MLSARPVTIALSCLVIAFSAALTGLSSADEPAAPATPAAIVAYHDSGEWRADSVAQIHAAKRFVRRYLANHNGPRRGRPAIILDIDDTSLSLYTCAKARDFVVSVVCAVTEPTLPVIPETLSLFRMAHKRGVAVFFITGRNEGLRALTYPQLAAAGYGTRNLVFMRPSSDTNTSLVPYKSGTRKAIEQAGFQIIANVGDQQSDLAGGYSLRAYKLPNPMYFTP